MSDAPNSQGKLAPEEMRGNAVQTDIEPNSVQSFDFFVSLRKYSAFLLWGIFFLALFLRSYNFSGDSLWTDEIATYWVCTAPTAAETVQRAVQTQGQSPFYYLIERGMLSVLPHNEFGLRFLSLACSLVGLFLIYRLALMIFGDAKQAVIAGTLFAVNEFFIYYAQEARPYSMGLMFAMLSQIYFLRMLKDDKRLLNLALYVLSTVLTIYSHYIFAGIVLSQNLYLGWLKFVSRTGETSLKKRYWFLSQALIGLSILLLLKQLEGMFMQRAGWNWLQILNPVDGFLLFIKIFNPSTLMLLGICFLIFLVFLPYEKQELAENFRGSGKKDTYLMLGIWLLTPYIFVCLTSYVLRISLFEPRYFVLALIPFTLIMSDLLCVFKTDILRIALPGAYLLIYLGMVSVPNCVFNRHFSKRISHDWRSAIRYINDNWRQGDMILVRAGFEKENWVPNTESPIIKDYSRSPFRTFYWKGPPKAPIYTLTYTWEEEFYWYYDLLFEKVLDHKRTWIIGVNPPNTNYPVANITRLLEKEFYVTSVSVADFSGVYLALISSDYAIRPASTADKAGKKTRGLD